MTDRAGAGPGWDPDRYDGDHAFVYEYGEDVLGLLAPEPGERVLDLGCGTGHLTAEMSASGAEVVGLDSSVEMLETARVDHPDLQFVRGDAQDFAIGDPLPADEPFDAVFSNATLHWMDDPDAAFESVAGALRQGGRFVGEFGGKGNVEAIVEAVAAELEARGYEAENPWYFPSVGEFASTLEGHGFEVRRAELFDRPTELEGGEEGLRSWLSMFGDSLLSPVEGDEREDVLAAVEDRLRPTQFEDGSWVADYRRLRFVAIRE
jgi:trans-aconitate methyltransferase